jgi:hypothetical protein
MLNDGHELGSTKDCILKIVRIGFSLPPLTLWPLAVAFLAGCSLLAQCVMVGFRGICSYLYSVLDTSTDGSQLICLLQLVVQELGVLYVCDNSE